MSEKSEQRKTKKEERIINILHLSDFHFGIPNKKGEENDMQFNITHDTILINLRNTLRNAVRSTKIDFVVISGDVAWQAKKNGYAKFVEWINQLLDDPEIGINRESVIMCPGNHDFNRNDKGGITEITEENQEEELKLDNIHKRVAPFEFYQKTCQDIKIKPLENSTENTKYLYGCRHFSNEGVLFAVFNSAWNETKDKLPIWLGDGQLLDVESLVAKIRDTERIRYPNDELLVISVFHHPLKKMNDSETTLYDRNKSTKVSRLSSFFTAMILNGHTHGKIEVFKFPFENEYIAEFNGGTIFSNDSKIFGFEIISINVSEWKCSQHHGICEGTQWRIDYDVKTDYFHYGKQIQEILKNPDPKKKDLHPVVLAGLEGFYQESWEKQKTIKKTGSNRRDNTEKRSSRNRQQDKDLGKEGREKV